MRPPGPATYRARVSQPGAGKLPRLVQWAGAHRLLVDSLVAGGAGLLLVTAYAGTIWPTAVLVAVEVAGLAPRRVRPVACMAVVFAAAFAHWLVGVFSSSPETLALLPSDVAVLVAVYSGAAYSARWARWAGLGVGLLGAVLSGSTVLIGSSGSPDYVGATVAAVVLGIAILLAWTAGQWRRTRLAYVEQVLEAARRAEHEHEQRVALAASDERARIARELHDVIAHSLAIVVAQADGGRFAAARDPEAATDALATVAATGRAALTDMRRLLGVLRDDGPAALTPQPDLVAVASLVATVRASGRDVALTQAGPAQPLPPAAALAVYRVVQESLTNVLKHAGDEAAAGVALRWTPTCLTVEVHDDGRGAAADRADGAGQGLPGMRERLALFGGRLEAGPGPTGGWTVRAELPLAAA